MEAFVSRKRTYSASNGSRAPTGEDAEGGEDASTEVKLAILASLHPGCTTEALLEALLASDGHVNSASRGLGDSNRADSSTCPCKGYNHGKVVGYQSSLSNFTGSKLPTPNSPRKVTKRGQTLHLYSPDDIAAHTPCSMIHNFLDQDIANALLREMLDESHTWGRDKFMLFDNVVESPHTICFYVDELEDAQKQKTEYVYNGSRIGDVRRSLPEMRKVSRLVQRNVNEAIQKRIKSHYPNGQKLRYQSPEKWVPNTSFVNCYDGGQESVGWHSDQLTYLGPRPVIGSISLGVAREFRVRRVVPRYTKFDPGDEEAKKANDNRADVEGQIAIHLPHNSLLIMHAEMQEEWKHSIAPAVSIDPHPIAGNKRINITYRCYRESFGPRYTPKCKCGVQTVLRCVQKQEQNRGKYMWMCHTSYTPGKKGCSFFEWAKFDDDGEPVWWRDFQAQRSIQNSSDSGKCSSGP